MAAALVPLHLLVEDAGLGAVHCAHGVAVVAPDQAQNLHVIFRCPAVAFGSGAKSHLDGYLHAGAAVIGVEDFA